MNYLLVDTATGIWEVATLEGESCEVMSQEDFLESLADFEDGKLIGTTVDAEFYSVLDAEYGIQFCQ